MEFVLALAPAQQQIENFAKAFRRSTFPNCLFINRIKVFCSCFFVFFLNSDFVCDKNVHVSRKPQLIFIILEMPLITASGAMLKSGLFSSVV